MFANVKRMGLYTMVVMNLNTEEKPNTTWSNFMGHFVKAYEMRLDSGLTAAGARYYDVAVVMSNNDNLGSIVGCI